MHRLLYAAFFLVLGVASGLSILLNITKPFVNTAVSVILLAKGTFWIYMYKAMKLNDTMRNTTMGKGFGALSAGAFLSSALFLAAAVNQEWSYGYIASPVVFVSGVVMSIAARRAKNNNIGDGGSESVCS